MRKYKELYDYLDSLGLSDYNALFSYVMRKWNQKELRRVVNYLFQLIKPGFGNEGSIFNFVSNSSLAGGLIPCSEPKCRVRNIKNLARFAALYSDCVLIPSPIDKHIHGEGEIIREHLLGDIQIIFELKPLIEAGLIDFITQDICLCKECLSKHLENREKFESDLALLYDAIDSEYLNNIHYTVKYEYNKPVVYVKAPEKYGLHKNIVVRFRKYVPKEIKQLVKPGEEVTLPSNVIREIGVLNLLTSDVIDDLILQNVWVNAYGSTYLTNREVDINMINTLHSKIEFEKSSRIVDALSHTLPIIQNVDLTKIVELRQKDGESFNVYRDSLTKILHNQQSYDIKDLKEMYRDKILPELNNINLTIKNNKKNLTGSIVSDVVFASSIVSVGLYKGLLPADIGQVLAAIGGVKFAYDLYSKVGKYIKEDESIRNNQFYFLWKLQQKGNRAI